MYPPLPRLPVPPLGAVPTCGVPMPQTYLCPFSSWSLQDALTANGSRPVTDRHPLPCYIVAPPSTRYNHPIHCCQCHFQETVTCYINPETERQREISFGLAHSSLTLSFA